MPITMILKLTNHSKNNQKKLGFITSKYSHFIIQKKVGTEACFRVARGQSMLEKCVGLKSNKRLDNVFFKHVIVSLF